jgi:hypothetical protein
MTEKISTLKSTLLNLDENDLHFLYIRLILDGHIAHGIRTLTNDDKINQILQFAGNYDYVAKQNIVKDILASRGGARVPESSIDWIDPTNERLCIFLWISASITLPPKQIAKYDRWGSPISNYEIHLMPLKPSNSSSCLKYFHDFLYVFYRPVSVKIEILNEARLQWEKATKFNHKMLKALDVNNDQVTRWFWTYSHKFLGNRIHSLDFDTFKERLPLVQAMWDKWEVSESDKIIALNKAYSAFHAKKFKEKPTNLKGANFWLGPEQIRMLNEIASRKKLSEKDALHSLVNDAYLKFIK